MTTHEIRQAYLDFYAKNGHAIVPSASLVPENDPTTLFTSAGMQSMIPYLMGETHPLGSRIANSQKCFRTQDIDEVGDNRHTTFFEMLGNWSIGDYFKAEQIPWIFHFLVDALKLDPSRLYVTVYSGDPELKLPKDTEAVELWQAQFKTVGLEATVVENASESGMGDARIAFYKDKNWWSRSGAPSQMPTGEIGGPDSEIFWDFGAARQLHEHSPFADQPCHSNCDCGRFLEIGNSVFMQYLKTDTGFEPLPHQNIDFGGGLERLAAAVHDDPDMFTIDLLQPLVQQVEALSAHTYGESAEHDASFRVIADHLRAACFLITDGAIPANKEQGYFVRRLIRRSIVKAHDLGITKDFTTGIAQTVIQLYRGVYDLPEALLTTELHKEETRFRRTLEQGLKRLELVTKNYTQTINGKELFDLYQSFGFPLELSVEEAAKHDLTVADPAKDEFASLLAAHQEQSRTTSAGMFKGGLQDDSEQTTNLHTAAHLLLEAMRRVLGDHVQQKGSNITAERLRFDFSHPTKITPEQIKEIETLVNEQIKRDLTVTKEFMSPAEAKAQGAQGVFDAKYGDQVSVYTVGDFSKEICGGPHVTHTGDMGVFKIQKEESSSAGVRRIKAILIN